MQTHRDVVVHGHKGIAMMHECKRILNKQVAGEGLWQAPLRNYHDRQKGDMFEVHYASAEEHSDGEARMAVAAEQSGDEEDGGCSEHRDDIFEGQHASAKDDETKDV